VTDPGNGRQAPPRRTGVDLHTHSTSSDGVLTPAELYRQMTDAGLWLAALSDHDTLEGYRQLRAVGLGQATVPATAADAGDAATTHGPRLIAAIEIDAVRSPELDPWPGDVHILGYGVDPDSADLERVLQQLRDWRRERFHRSLAQLREAGAPVEDALPNDLDDGSASAGRPHLARALVAKGLAVDVNDAFDRWLKPGRPGFATKQGLGPRAAIEAIRAAGGLAVLAHSPGVITDDSRLTPLRAWGLAGLEVHYFGGHRAGTFFPPSLIPEMAAVAKRHGLLATGGSDYHGDGMSYLEKHADIDIPDEVGDRLLDALAEVRAGRP
jgi:predicted metal-dependent phosphoesterase TrpH